MAVLQEYFKVSAMFAVQMVDIGHDYKIIED